MRLAVIDDHPPILEAVVMLAKLLPGGWEATGFESLASFEPSARQFHYDLVLLDLRLPGYHGLDSLKAYRECHPSLPVVVLSAEEDARTILAALELGAMGFIPKSSRREILLGAIEIVMSGGIYVPPQAVRGGPEKSSSFRASPSPHQARADDDAGMNMPLRQRQVLALLLKGLPDKLICRELDLSHNTVKTHLKAIYARLDATSRTQAVIAAQRLGIRVDY